MTTQCEFGKSLLLGKPSGLSELAACKPRCSLGVRPLLQTQQEHMSHVLSSKSALPADEHLKVVLPAGEFCLTAIRHHFHIWKQCFKGQAQKLDSELTIQLWRQTELNKPCFTQLH